MACEDIEERIKDLKAEKQNLEKSITFLKGRSLALAQKNLARLEGQVASEQLKLKECMALEQQLKNPTPRPFVGRVKSISCSKASKEVGKEEPYVLVASVDMLAQGQIAPLPPVTKPAVHCFKIGPWSHVKAGSTLQAHDLDSSDNPAFWDLDSQARIIISPQDVLFLVGLVENDGGSPDAVRGAVQTALGLSVVQNMNRSYDTFASTLASSMAGAIDTASVAGLDPLHLNSDDRIGRVEQLSLTAGDLDRINALGSHEKSLSFKSVKKSGKVTNQYKVTFSFAA